MAAQSGCRTLQTPPAAASLVVHAALGLGGVILAVLDTLLQDMKEMQRLHEWGSVRAVYRKRRGGQAGLSTRGQGGCDQGGCDRSEGRIQKPGSCLSWGASAGTSGQPREQKTRSGRRHWQQTSSGRNLGHLAARLPAHCEAGQVRRSTQARQGLQLTSSSGSLLAVAALAWDAAALSSSTVSQAAALQAGAGNRGGHSAAGSGATAGAPGAAGADLPPLQSKWSPTGGA